MCSQIHMSQHLYKNIHSHFYTHTHTHHCGQVFKDIRRKIATATSHHDTDTSTRSEMDRMMQKIKDLTAKQAEFELALKRKEEEKQMIYQVCTFFCACHTCIHVYACILCITHCFMRDMYGLVLTQSLVRHTYVTCTADQCAATHNSPRTCVHNKNAPKTKYGEAKVTHSTHSSVVVES
jgi:hypothetical protein